MIVIYFYEPENVRYLTIKILVVVQRVGIKRCECSMGVNRL